jgi:alpha-methylacyl-CoA racemase
VLLEKLEISDLKFQDQQNKELWPELKAIMKDKIKEKTRDEWAEIFDGSDACVAPVLNLSEAPEHHHMKARNSFVEVDGIIQPAPAPRFSDTAADIKHASVKAGENNDEICARYNLDRSCFS